MNTSRAFAPAVALLCAAASVYPGCIAGSPPPSPVNNDHAFAVTVQGDGRIVAAGSSVHSATTESVFALARYNPDGTPDASFGAGGKVTTDMFFRDSISDAAVQGDGRIVAVGRSYFDFESLALTRYDASGRLDPTFGRGGKVMTAMGAEEGSAGATAVAIQDDGRIVVAGWADNGGRVVALVRYLGDGTPDNTFGAGGTVFAGGVDNVSSDAQLALQGDGRIVVVWNSGARAGSPKFTIARYLGDGSPDAAFGAGGKVTSSSGYHDTVTAVAVQADGKIVAAGCSYVAGVGYGWYDLVLRRFNGDGTPDLTFGEGGKVPANARNGLYPCTAYGVRIGGDGKIVVAGASWPNFVLARCNPDGTPDNAFGSGGKVTEGSGDRIAVSDVAVQADGRIVVGGGVPGNATGLDFAVKRYNSDGSRDAAFGSGGMATTAF